MTNEYLCIPGYMPVKEAARRLHRSEKRILQYITAHRLPASKIQGRYMIPIAAIDTFHPYPHGRTRSMPVLWRLYRAGAQVRLLSLEIPAITEHQTELLHKLHDLPCQQNHLFPGTMHRFIWFDEQNLVQMRMVLIWKTTDLQDETVLQLQLEHFQHDFADVLDWEHASIHLGESIAYT